MNFLVEVWPEKGRILLLHKKMVQNIPLLYLFYFLKFSIGPYLLTDLVLFETMKQSLVVTVLPEDFAMETWLPHLHQDLLD